MNVEIEIPIAQLKCVLPGLAKVAGRSSTLPVLQCIKASLDRTEKEITLQAHSLEEVATVRLPNAASGLSGEMLVPLDMLTKVVKGCGADESIRLIGTKQESRIRYPVGASFIERALAYTSVEEWPEVKTIDREPIVLSDSFKPALKQALECASADSSRYVLNGACLDVRSAEGHCVVGTDARHLYCANSFTFDLPEPLIIPATKFLTWPAFINDGPWKLRMLPGIKVDPADQKSDRRQESPPWFKLESERWSYTGKAIDGQFPNWWQVVPLDMTGWTEVLLEPNALVTMLEAIPLLPGNEEINSSVTLLVGKSLSLCARGKDQPDWTTIEIRECKHHRKISRGFREPHVPLPGAALWAQSCPSAGSRTAALLQWQQAHGDRAVAQRMPQRAGH